MLGGGVGCVRERRKTGVSAGPGARAGSFGRHFLFPSSVILVKLKILFCRKASLDS